MATCIKDMSADAAILIAELSQKEKGTVITFEEFQAMLGYDIRSRRNVVNTANNNLIRLHSKSLGSVRGVGYKILTDAEVAEDALARQRKARQRSANRSKRQAGTVDIAKLPPSQRCVLLAEVAAAHIAAEASSDNSQKKLAARLGEATRPLALAKALDALRGSIERNGKA